MQGVPTKGFSPDGPGRCIPGRTVAISVVWVMLATFVFPQVQDSQRRSQAGTFTSFFPFFRSFNPKLERFEFQDKKKINDTYSAVVIRATSSEANIREAQGDIHALLKQEAFGIFVVRNTDSKPVLAVDVLPSERFLDYEVHLIAAGIRHIIISKGGGDYGMDAGRTKYFYDLENRRLLGKVSHYGMSMSSIVEFEGDLYFIGSGDRESAVITRLKPDPADLIRDYQIIDRIAGRKLSPIQATRKEGSSLVLLSEAEQYSLSGGKWSVSANPNPVEFRSNPPTGAIADLPDMNFWQPPFRIRENLVQLKAAGKPGRILLVWNSDISDNSHGLGEVPGIYEITGKKRQFFPLPPATNDTFRKYRPEWVRVQGGQLPEHYDQNIGPFQLVGDKLWFGITFYDGEGSSGIGGAGYFDSQSNQFHIDHYPEVAAWPAASILVENGDVWLGLIGRPEGAVTPGGLVRFGQKGGKVTKYDVPAIIKLIRKPGGLLYLGTSDGIFVLRDGKIIRLTHDLDLNGKYSLKIE